MLTATFEVDHIIPLHRGGDDNYETNCHALCRECHSIKTQCEEVERLRVFSEHHSSTTLTCSKCQWVVSPYFKHKCVNR